MRTNLSRTCHSPPRYKIFLLTWLAIYPLINLVLIVFGALLDALPLLLRTLLLTFCLVFLMTYYVMPWMNRRFDDWLYQPTLFNNVGN